MKLNHVATRSRDSSDRKAQITDRSECRTTGARTPFPRHSDREDLGSTATTDPRLKALYRVAEAMVLLSMSRTVIYEEMRAGRLRYVLQGTVRRITAAAITEYVTLLENEMSRGTA